MARLQAGWNIKAKKCIDSLADSLLGKYIGTALTIENQMSGWASKEVSEMNPQMEAPERV